jgi:hypothetical protein
LAATGIGGDLIKEIYQVCGAQFPLVDENFKVSANGCLRLKRQIVDATDLETLLHWITPDIIERFDNSLKDRFRTHILFALRRRLGVLLHKHDHEKLSKLPIFKKLVPCESETGPHYKYVMSCTF